MFEFPPRSYTCRVCTGALPRPHHLLMAHSVREALHISFLLLILVRMLLAALEAVSAAMVLLQTIPHFQQSGRCLLMPGSQLALHWHHTQTEPG